MWTYTTSLKWQPGQDGRAETAGRPALEINSPPEFGGKPDRWSPELLLVSAVENCLMLTSLDIAKRQKLNVAGYESTAVGHMEKTAEGLRFTGIDVTVRVKAAAAEAEKVKQAVLTAEKYCPVSNAMKIPVRLNVGVET